MGGLTGNALIESSGLEDFFEDIIWLVRGEGKVGVLGLGCMVWFLFVVRFFWVW